MSAPSDKHAPPHAGAAAAASGSHHDKPPEKEESSFARWKKKFTSKTKKAEISATPAALTMMNVAATYRAASQRAAMRVLRLWKQNVEAAKAKEAADQARAKLAAQPTAGMSGLGLGLAGAFGSPINRPRQSTTPKAAGSTASPKAPRSPQLPQFSFEDKTVTEMNEAEQSEEISKGVPIPRSSGHPVTNAISSTHAFSSSPALPSVLTSTSVPDGADVFAPAGSPTLAGSKTMMLPHRRIASSTESIDSISGELATPSKRMSSYGTWSSVKPTRPSIIQTRRTPSMSPQQRNSGIDPALLSPTVAFHRSLGVRDSIMLTQAIQRANSKDSSEPSTPTSPGRLIPTGSPPPADLVPHAMKAHPRGSVLLGDIHEFGAKGSIREGQEEDDEGEEGVDEPLPSPATALRRQNTRVVKRWRAAIKQIMALALWAKKRTVSRAVLSVPPHLRELAAHELEKLDTADTATAAAAAVDILPSPSPASVAKDGWTPRNTLLDYFLTYRTPTAQLDELTKELRGLAGTDGRGLTTRKHLENFVTETNEKLAAATVEPELSARYPLEDREGFSVDNHWSSFGFQEGVRVSLVPRVTQCYSSVMTLADGIALFATYLRYDVPLLPEIPHAFHPSSHSATALPSVSPEVKVKMPFWDEKHPMPTGPAAAAHITPAKGPVNTRPSVTGALSTGAMAITHVASPQIQGPPLPIRAWSSPTSPTSPIHSQGIASFHPQIYAPYCMVLISHYPQFEVLRTIAQQLFELACSGGVSRAQHGHPGVKLEDYLRALCFEIPLPIPRHAAVRFRIHRAVCTTQFCGVRGSTQSNQNLDLLFRTLNVDNVIGVLAAILTENRILFHSTSLNMLTFTMQAFLQLLYPFQYWYSFVPQLTSEMLDAHQIPQPYLLGVHSKHLPELTSLDEVLIVDLDHDVLRCSHPLTPLPQKEGRSLWMDWRRTYEKIQITKFDQVDDVRTDVAALDKTSKPNTANGASSHVTLRSSLRRASFTMPSGLVPITPQTPGVGGLSPYPGVTPAGGAHQPATSIAAVLPASAFSFDEEIYAALLRFYSDLLSGYKKFLFFISDVPFFNAQGFLTQRVAREPTSLEFYKAFVSSRSFDVFIEEESQPDVYHEYFGAASEFSVGANRIQTILAQDFGATERILVMPYPGHHHEGELLSDGGRVEVGVTQLGSDDVIQAVVLDPPTASHTAAATTSTPFSTPFTLTDPASAHRALHWVGMEQDLPHYKSASTQLVPRKPKQLSSAASMTESHGSSFGLGENLSPHAGNSTGFATASNQADASKTSQSTLPAGSASAPTSSDKSKQQARSKKGPHVEASGEHRIKLMLSEIFSSQTLKKEELKDFTQLLQEPQMRRVFATILSQPKQGGSTSGSGGSGSTPSSSQGTSASLCLTQAGFDQLSSLVKALLDACLPSKDYASASAGALDVGNVYFREETKTHVRTYLESTLRRHPIWQSLEFWRANLGLALSHRALKAEKAHSHSLPTSPTGDEEWVLQWMISAAHSMMSNNVPPAKVEELMMDVCASHHLKPETRETIMSFLAKIKEAAQYW